MMNLAILIGHVVDFCIVLLFYNTVSQQKRKPIFTILNGLSLYCIVFFLYIIFDSSIVNLIAETVFNLVFGILFYKAKVLINIFYSLFLTISLTASEFLIMALVSVGSNNINTHKESAESFLLLCLFSRIVFLIIVLLVGNLLQKNNVKKMPIFLILFPIASTAILYTLWLIASENDNSTKINLLIAISSLSVISSVLLTYIFYSKTYRELNNLYALQKEHNRELTDTAYYSIIDKQNVQLKALLHNEKNHLSTIKSLANNPDVNEYIDKIYGEIVENSLVGNSKNKMLDLTINKYQYICSNENINFNVSITTANLSYIEPQDLITLLGNLLDNAVDAAKMSKNRTINLSLNKVNGFDVLTCTNSCDYTPQTISNDLITTKKDGWLHGLGVRSIKRITKKYHGNFEWTYDEFKREFNAYIAF